MDDYTFDAILSAPISPPETPRDEYISKSEVDDLIREARAKAYDEIAGEFALSLSPNGRDLHERYLKKAKELRDGK